MSSPPAPPSAQPPAASSQIRSGEASSSQENVDNTESPPWIPFTRRASDSSSSSLFPAINDSNHAPAASPKLAATRGDATPNSPDWVPLPARKSFGFSPSSREFEAVQAMFEGSPTASRAARGSFNAHEVSQVVELQPMQPPQPSPFASSDAAAVNVFILLDAESLSSYQYIPALNPQEDQRMLTLQLLCSQHTKPFCEWQEDIFKKSRTAQQLAARWLHWRGWLAICTIPVAMAVFASVPLANFKHQEPSPDAFLTITLVFIALSTMLSNGMSMAFTGNFPDISSSSANEEQNALQELQARYEDIAHYMLNIVQDPATHKYAERLAQSFDAARMKEQLTQAITQRSRIEPTCKLLFAVMHYVATSDTAHNSALERIIATEKRIADLWTRHSQG